MSFSTRQLKYFVAVAELGQISHASKELSISQSAVTMAIKEIEARLGQAVFFRSSNGVMLTDVGRLFLPKAKQILQILTEINHLTEVTQSNKKLVKIT